MLSRIIRRSYINNAFTKSLQYKHIQIDYSKVPKLDESDLEEKLVRGSGPGGQNINKTSNCVVLKHIPTGIVVKCHESRLQHHNKAKARELLITKLDNFLNGNESVEAQRKAVLDKKSQVKMYKKSKLQNLKEQWKKRENLS